MMDILLHTLVGAATIAILMLISAAWCYLLGLFCLAIAGDSRRDLWNPSFVGLSVTAIVMIVCIVCYPVGASIMETVL